MRVGARARFELRAIPVSVAKMGLQRSSTTISAPFFSFLAIESLARPRDEAIFKQALNNDILGPFLDEALDIGNGGLY